MTRGQDRFSEINHLELPSWLCPTLVLFGYSLHGAGQGFQSLVSGCGRQGQEFDPAYPTHYPCMPVAHVAAFSKFIIQARRPSARPALPIELIFVYGTGNTAGLSLILWAQGASRETPVPQKRSNQSCLET